MLSTSHRSVVEVEMFDTGIKVYFSVYGGSLIQCFIREKSWVQGITL